MRRLLLLPALLLAATPLAACGSDDDPTTTDPNASEMPMDEMDGAQGMDGHMDGDTPATRPPVDGARQVEVTGEDLAFEPDEITVRARRGREHRAHLSGPAPRLHR